MARIELPCPVCGANVVHSFPDYFSDTCIECPTEGCAFAVAANHGTCACTSREDDIRRHYRFAVDLYRRNMQNPKWLSKHEHEITIRETEMAKKTMEDWFLRGGAKPQSAEKGKDGVSRIAELAVCQNCGKSWQV